MQAATTEATQAATSDAATQIVLRNLAVGYTAQGNRRAVLQGLNAVLTGGSLTCLIGANGTGKSTLLRTIAGFQPKLAGEALIGGTDIASLTPKQLAHMVSVVLTTKPDIQAMTVSEVVGLGRTPYTGFWGRLSATDRAVVNRCLAAVGISHLAQRMVNTLSDGERQKAMIAKALAQETPFILLDEPTAFLDYTSKVDTMLLLRRLARNERKAILLSTHDLELALQTADALWLLTTEGQATKEQATKEQATKEQATNNSSPSLMVGTPRQLADSGHLSHYINHEGITLNTATLQISVG